MHLDSTKEEIKGSNKTFGNFSNEKKFLLKLEG